MNIIFDIGKVLIDFDFEGFVEKLYPPKAAEAVIAATWHNPDWTELDRGVLSDEEVLKLFISKAPEYEREVRDIFARLGQVPYMKDTTIPLIKRLKADGHKVYYLSNYFEYLIHTCPWALEFIPYTDGGVFSCRVKVTKPDAEIYRILCERYSLDPADCVFIDDSPKNIVGAEAFGIRGILYTSQSPDELYAQIFG
ncbi:MAG: HAD family phosphatase [Ruminococcus sp.]|nr:HAD family phosphatase [Ruminococcus sp.]